MGKLVVSEFITRPVGDAGVVILKYEPANS